MINGGGKMRHGKMILRASRCVENFEAERLGYGKMIASSSPSLSFDTNLLAIGYQETLTYVRNRSAMRFVRLGR